MKILKTVYRDELDFTYWYHSQSEFSTGNNFSFKEGFNKNVCIFYNYYIE